MSMGVHHPYHLDLCADDEDPFQLTSGLDGMPLTFDAFRERSVLGLVCLDKWVWFSALHMTML